MLKNVLLGFLLLLLVLPTTSNAHNAAITNGLNWLKSSQDATGSWSSGQSSSTVYYTTATALETFTVLGDTSNSYTTGLNWLSAGKVESTTYLAPKIKIVATSGGDTEIDVNTLLTYRNSDGGWGGYTKFTSSNLHTALALQSLRAANYPDLTTINNALAYLTTNQNPDGGWGVNVSITSNIYLTAIVSTTLQQFPQTTVIATAVSKATIYLLAHQNPDGGFGSSTGSGQVQSTAYETALAYTALAAFFTNEAVLTNAVNYLTANQSTNGSWNDDPYATALALRALYLSENRPAPPPPPPAAGKFTGSLLDTITRQGVSGAAVVLESSPLINTTTDPSGNFTLSDVPPGSQKVNFSLSGYLSTTTTATSIADTTNNLGLVTITSAYTTGAISGTILDPSGKPLSGVAISVSGSWSGTAVTGLDGSFSFSYVTPGDVTITASKTGISARPSAKYFMLHKLNIIM